MHEFLSQIHELAASARSAEPQEVERALRDLAAPRLVAAVRAAQRRGLPFDGAVRALAREMRLAAREAQEIRRVLVLLRGRMALGIGGASMAHAWVMRSLDPWAGMAALAIAVVVHAYVQRRVPRAWVEDEAAVAAWVTDYAGVTDGTTRELTLREVRLGVSMEREKRALLRDLARRRRLEARIESEKLIDSMPLFELVGIGAPAALLLAAPVLAQATLGLTLSTS